MPSGLPVTNGSNNRPATSAGRPRSRIRDLDRDALSRRGQPDGDLAAAADGIDRVPDQVGEQVAELAGVAFDPDVGRRAAPTGARCRCACTAAGAARSRPSGGRPGPPAPARPAPGRPRSMNRRRFASIWASWRRVTASASVSPSGVVGQVDLDRQLCPGHPVAELVGQAGRQLAGQPEPLGRLDGLLQSGQPVGHLVDRGGQVRSSSSARGSGIGEKSPPAICRVRRSRARIRPTSRWPIPNVSPTATSPNNSPSNDGRRASAMASFNSDSG